jgi:hypothetical protein
MIAPLIIPTLFVLEGALVQRVDDRGAFTFMSLSFGIPLSYIASFALGLPTYHLLVRWALDRFWLMLLLGAVAGPMVLLGAMRLMGPPLFGTDRADALHGVVYGAAYAAVWYMIVDLLALPTRPTRRT